MTGFTYEVVEKKIDFPTFVMRCARAFMPLIEMRDEPMDAVIPDEFKPSSYHVEGLAEAQKELARLKKMTKNQRDRYGLRKKNQAIRAAKQCLRSNMSENRLLNNMLSEVNAWEPPTTEHLHLKKFMQEQLTTSLHDLSWSQKNLKDCQKTTPVSFFRKALNSAKRDIEYHTEHLELDKKNAAFSTNWVKELRKSLAATA